MPDSNLGNLGLENLKMRQTWIQEITQRTKDLYKYDDISEAFQDLALSLIFDIGIDDIDNEEVVDAPQDKQIDIIHIEKDDDERYAHVHILQVKYATGFKSTTVTKIKNGLYWLFSAGESEYTTLDNPQFVNKIQEFRELRLKLGQSKISITVYYVTYGNSSSLSPEYLQEKKSLEMVYQNFGFAKFEFKEIGAFELFDFNKRSEQSRRKIGSYRLPIVYDVNKPSIINYSTSATRSMICTIKGKDLAILAQTEPKDAIFDMNVRRFYGIEKNPVNSAIFAASTNDIDSSLFWFLNNGITMVCEHFEFSNDPDTHVVDLQGVQIVNGCQTAVTLREAYENGQLRDNVDVLIRIYETRDRSLTNRITLTTNTQNRIVGRDLKSNDIIQEDIQKVMLDSFGYYYERKPREYTDLTPEQNAKIISNEKAGQAYLAIVCKKPSIARGFLGRVWGEHYDEIFKQASVEDLLLTYMIHRYCNKIAKKIKRDKEIDKIDKEIATYGSFHIARVIGFQLMHDKWGSAQHDTLIFGIGSIEEDPEFLNESYKAAFEIIKDVEKEDHDEHIPISYYYKAHGVEEAIEKRLYS